MNYLVKGGARTGSVDIPASKSCAHRLLICASLSPSGGKIICDGISEDIAATARCMSSLGSEASISEGVITVAPRRNTEGAVTLECGESGSTLRFLLPVAGALGADAAFRMQGKLKSRPMSELTNLLNAHGMTVYQDDDMLYCSGRLTAGKYSIPGNISSQYVSGLLFALPLIDGDSVLEVTGNIESADYISITEDAVLSSGISFEKSGNVYRIKGNQSYSFNGTKIVERDWSNAAFFLCMGAYSPCGVTVNGMPADSRQGDKRIIDVLRDFGAEITLCDGDITVKKSHLKGITVDASAIPDLVPVISALAAGAEGTTVIKNASRLRFKESDRLKTTSNMLSALGADIKETADGLIIKGKNTLRGGCVDAANDHRIAMAAAVAASVCEGDTEIIGAECVKKSYPDFWKHLEHLEVCR